MDSNDLIDVRCRGCGKMHQVLDNDIGLSAFNCECGRLVVPILSRIDPEPEPEPEQEELF